MTSAPDKLASHHWFQGLEQYQQQQQQQLPIILKCISKGN